MPSPGPTQDGSGRRFSGRRNITLWLDKQIIAASGAAPAAELRKWIEAHHPASRWRSPRLSNLERFRLSKKT